MDAGSPADRKDDAGKEPQRHGPDVRLLVPALVAWVAVLLALPGSPAQVGLAAILVVTLAVGIMLPVRARGYVRGRAAGAAAVLALAAVAAGLALAATAAQISVRSAGLVPELTRQRAVATVRAQVVSDPRVLQGRGPRSTPLVVVRLRVEQVLGRGQVSRAATPVLVFGDQKWSALRWHERVTVTGRFGPAQPGDDVVAVLSPTRPPSPISGPGPIADAAERLRSGLRTAASGLPADPRGLLPGLVVGDRSRTPADLTEAMQATGLSHLDAVSGTNVSMVLAAALWSCSLLGVRRRWRPGVAVLVLVAFVVVARPEPSVLRAAVMGMIGLAGLARSTRRAGIPALSGAVVVLLCVDPWLARSYGFALSTLATLGLLLFVRPWGDWIAKWLPARLGWLGPAVAIPVAAQAMCGPVVVLLQGSVSVVGVAANLLAAPLVAPATLLGVAATGVALVSPPAAAIVAWPAGMAAQGIAWVARTAAEVPLGSLPWPDGVPGALLLAVVTVLLLFGGPWLAISARRRPLVAAALALVTVSATWPTGSAGRPPTRRSFVACDVGQGDGLVLVTGGGRAVVIDAGPDADVMDACLRRLAVTVVDAVVLTHFHADHVDGLPGVLRGRTVRQILTSPVAEPDFQAREVLLWAAAVGVPVQRLYAGDRLVWDGIVADVLWPARVIREGSVPNNASIVLAVSLGSRSSAGSGSGPSGGLDSGPVGLEAGVLRVLLLGDLETAAAHQVLLALRRDPAYGRADAFDVLKVAHHGSRLQDAGLVEQVRAPLAVISVGVDNGYGHPAGTTLALLRRTGHEVLRTDRQGDIVVSRDGRGRVLVATHPP